MKKIFALTAVLILAAAGLAGAVPKTNVGCGFGTQIFSGNDGLASQVCAATTNGLLGNQTFGISSGTLDCAKPAQFWSERINTFVAENMDNLATDIAAGQGETLNTLAYLMEIPAEKRGTLYASLQTNFSAIYPSPQVTHDHVVEQIIVIAEQI